jgi:hypothetical protein
MGYTVAQLVEALRCKPDVRVFGSRWCHWQSFRSRYGSEVESTCNKNEYQEYFMRGKGGRCVVLTTWRSSYASTSWNPQDLSRPVQGLLYLFCIRERRLPRWQPCPKEGQLFGRTVSYEILNSNEGAVSLEVRTTLRKRIRGLEGKLRAFLTSTRHWVKWSASCHGW